MKMKIKNSFKINGYLLIITFFIFCVIGEVKCFIKFINCDFEPSYKAEIIYGLGTFSGGGVIIGYMDFGK